MEADHADPNDDGQNGDQNGDSTGKGDQQADDDSAENAAPHGATGYRAGRLNPAVLVLRGLAGAGPVAACRVKA